MKKIILYTLILILPIFICAKIVSTYSNDYSCEYFSIKSSNNFHVITFKKDKVKFGVSNSTKGNFNFYVNSNFFSTNGKAIGGVVMDGKRKSQRVNKGGSFIVKDGKPNIVFGSVDNCQYESQSIIWVLKNGVKNTGMLKQPHAKEKVMRLLMGKNKKGEIVVIHSNQYILVTMSEIVNIAVENGMTDAIILDSGSSVDLMLTNGSFSHSVKSVPSEIKDLVGIKEPPVYITGSF
jgi:hypothetical protein